MNTPLPPEPVLALLRKVKALADNGHEGERSAACARLDALLAKHGLTEEQLSDTERRLYGFKYSTERERLLLVCIVAHVANGGRMPDSYSVPGSRAKRVYFKLTHAEHVDVITRFRFYQALWEEELSVFFRAFVNAQHVALKREESDDATPPDAKQLAEERRMSAISQFVTRRTPHRQLV